MSAFDKWVKRSGGGPAAAANRETQMNRQPQRVQRFQVPKREARESFNGWVSRTGGGPAAAKNISTSGYVSPILQRQARTAENNLKTQQWLQTKQHAYANRNTGFSESGLSRNAYDSRVRSKTAQSDSDAAEIIRGMNTAEVMLPHAQRQMEQVVQKYGGSRESDGTFTFQTQEGVDAYNTAAVTLQEIQDRYEQTQRAYEQLQLQYADSQVKLSDLRQSRKDASKKMATQADSMKINQLDQQINAQKAQSEALKEQLDQVEKHLSGARDATLYDLTVNSFKRGMNNAKLGVELNDQMNGQNSDAQKYLDRLDSEQYNFMPEGAFEQAVSGSIEQLGQMFANLTDPNTLTTALATAGTAYAATQLAGGAALPDEIISVPAAAAIGLKAGTANQNRMVEAGLAYQEMIENGISEDTAKKIANYVGLANAALEFVQLDELIKAFGVLGKSGAPSTVLQKLAKELAKRGADVAKETAQEVAQEGVTITGAQLANRMETSEWAYGAEEVKERLKDTAQASALAFAGLNVPAAASNLISTARRIPDSTAFSVQAPSTARTRRGETVPEQWVQNNGIETSENLEQSTVNSNSRSGVVWAGREQEPLRPYMEPAKIQTKNKKSNAVIAKNPSPGTDRSTASGFNTNISEIGSGVNGNLAFRQTGERTELPPLRSRDDNTNSSSGVLWAGSDTSQSADADSSPQGEPLMRRVAFSGAAKPGLVKDQTYRKARYTAKTERTLDTIAKAAGVQVRIVDRVDVQDADGNVVGDANARYIPETATIEISRSTQDPVRAVFVHEVVHRIRDTAPEAYTQMAKYVVDTMDENRYTDAIDTRAEWYRTNDASYLQEEVVADAFGRVLSDSAALDRFVQSNRNIAQRILDALQDFIDAIRGRTGDGKLSDAKAQEVQEFVDSADEMVRLLEHALKWTDGQKNTSSMGGKAKHSLNADFGRQFDAWLSQNNEQQRLRSNGYFLVGTTSDALKSIGIDDYRIYFGQGKIAKIMQKHPAMTAEVIKSVPDILEHPVLVMQSQTVANRITLFGETVDANGKPVLVALELSPQNKRGEVLDFVVITSAYGKNNAQHLIDASDILYIDPDKKRTNSWLRLLRLQLPSRVTSYGSVQRVTLLNRDVNGNLTFGERGGKTDMQLAFEKAMAEKRRTRFSLKTPIEGSADLIALHNLTEQNLLDALRLGGMPMPSIAVTKTDLPHLEFGDITLVLDKNSIDPGADSRNRVYGADIGSSIAPEEAQTLEEIVEAMKQSRRLPEGVGAMSLQAAVAPSYESLQQLWKDSGRLGRMEGPEFQADLEAVNRQIEEILRQVRQGQVDAEAADAAVALRNAAGSTKTEQAIAQSFAEDGYALDSKLVAQIQTAFQAAAELPTEYFEAKPERVVGFDEVLAAVVPDDSSRELLAGLDAAGVQTLKYRTGDDADRVEQVNSVQQARFSPGSAQKRTGRTNSDSGVIWAGSDTSQSASRPAPLKGSRSNSSSGVLWRGSETAMDSPDQAVYNEAGKGQSTSSSNSSSGILWAGSEKAPVEKAHSVREINEPKSVKRQLKRLSPEAKKGYDKAVTAIKSGDTRGLNDHPLRGNRSGQRAIDIKGTGKGRGAGRIVYKYGENGEIDIIEILMDHDY